LSDIELKVTTKFTDGSLSPAYRRITQQELDEECIPLEESKKRIVGMIHRHFTADKNPEAFPRQS
jgi:hypothetical protein